MRSMRTSGRSVSRSERDLPRILVRAGIECNPSLAVRAKAGKRAQTLGFSKLRISGSVPKRGERFRAGFQHFLRLDVECIWRFAFNVDGAHHLPVSFIKDGNDDFRARAAKSSQVPRIG